MEQEKQKRKVFPEDLGRSLFLRHCRGDASAFAELMKLFQGQVYSYLVRSGVSPSDQDDLFQDIVLRIHRAREQYDQSRALFPWIFTITVNAVRSHFRQKGSLQVSEPDESRAEADGPGSLELYEHKEMAAWLEMEIRKLTLPEREALILCCVENIEQSEAAKLLDIPLNTLKTHLRRGRMKLASALTRRNALISREVLQ